MPTQLTVAGYQAWLKSAHTPEAAKTLKAFTRLPNLKKYLFVQHLQKRSAYKAPQTQLKGGPRGLHTMVPYNKFVSFAHNVRVVKTGGRKPATKVTFTVTERIFNISVTAETVWVTYQATKGRRLAVTDGDARTVNTNAAIAVKAQDIGTGPERRRGPHRRSVARRAACRLVRQGCGPAAEHRRERQRLLEGATGQFLLSLRSASWFHPSGRNGDW
ncbi:hypothetical protein ACWERI_38280 [Streptomyces collinus]